MAIALCVYAAGGLEEAREQGVGHAVQFDPGDAGRTIWEV